MLALIMRTAPRTDAEVVRINYGHDMVTGDFARQLEYECADLAAALRLCLKLLQVHGDMESLGAERFDLTDAPELKPVFSALEKVKK